MLHRSFKAGKCKTSLKLAVARIKLLKNKRQVQLNQMKRDLAHLLETGQEKTAMIRVEHVVREEKTMAAYDFIDIYCELIVARLPIIESQKNCPIDLKEAVSSLVFAAPRCSDIPELIDVRKHFTAKYGKEFATSALELRPDCGVNRTVVENLSARAPDGQTKLKILTKIAQEHSVQWDPKDFGEKELKPSEDLLNGPQATEAASRRPVEPLVSQYPPSVQQPESSYLHNAASARSFQSSESTNSRIPNTTMHTSTDLRASGGATESREFEHRDSQYVNHSSLNRQSWNMEFKDATSAAQAAAESAERASFAAKAAADLAGFGKATAPHKPLMQDQQRHMHERESAQRSSDHVINNQETLRRRSSQSVSSEIAKNEDDPEKADIYCQKCSTEVDAADNSWQTKKPEESNIQPSHFGVASVEHHEEINRPVHINSMKEGRRKSSRSLSDDKDDVIPLSNVQKYGYDGDDQSFFDDGKWNTSRDTRQTKQPEESNTLSTDFGVTSVDRHRDVNIFRDTSPMEEVIKRKPHRSLSSFSDDNIDVNSVSNTEKYGYDGGEQSFSDTVKGSMQGGTRQPSFDDYPSVIFDETVKGSMQSGTRQPSFDDYPPVVFDGTVSDDESFVHNVLYDNTQGISPPSRFSGNFRTSSPDKYRGGLFENTSRKETHLFRESNSLSEDSEVIKISSPSKSSDLLPAAFDDSDGEISENEGINNDKYGGIIESTREHHNQKPLTTQQESVERVTSTSLEKQTKVVNRKPHLHSSSDESDSGDAYPGSRQVEELNVRSEKRNFQPSVEHTRISDNLADDNSVAYNPVMEETQQQQGQLPSSRYSLTRDLKTKEDSVVPGSHDKVKGSETSSYLSSESGKELGFGVLRGGFRNKGYTRPPYHKGLSVDNSPQSNSQQEEDSNKKFDVYSEVSPNPNSDTREASSQRSSADFNNTREASSQRSSADFSNELRSRGRKTTFESDSDDDEMIMPQTAGSRGKLGSRLSHRTRDPPTSDISSHSLSTSGSRMTVPGIDDSSRQDIHATEIPSNSQIQGRGSGSRRPVDTSMSGKQTTNPKFQSRRGGNKLASANISVEQQSLKSTRSEQPLPESSAVEQSSNLSPKSGTAETQKGLSWNKKPESGDNSGGNSFKKASHVHPKLPDYDTFAAHFESLKSRR